VPETLKPRTVEIAAGAPKPAQIEAAVEQKQAA
jgi:hypothetical protein